MKNSAAPILFNKPKSIWRRIFERWELYVFLVPAVVYLVLFNYAPMYGILMAFKDFRPSRGILGSEWVGLKHFQRFISMPAFGDILRNTLTLSLYSLFASFPLPIVLALSMNSCEAKRFRKAVQTITYIPYFISMVVLVGMINIFFSPSLGIISNMLKKFGMLDGTLNILVQADKFPHLYVWSGVWQNIGWNSIIYMSALSAVDPALHEAAVVDGASKFQRIRYIDFPAILPTVVIMLILDTGKIMNVGFEKVYLMQNAMNLSTSEIISTYVYKIGIQQGKYSLSTAINLFNSIINFILLLSVNFISKKAGQASIW